MAWLLIGVFTKLLKWETPVKSRSLMEKQLALIKRKLSAFLKKYYTGMLLKGAILFVAAGGVYFLITVAIEYFLWLSPGLRTGLFWVFVLVETLLFIKFILIPLLYLFRIRKGMDEKTASRMIGAHFKEVDDKLLNLLQLAEQPEQSELLLAGIEKRSEELGNIPFQNAIRLSANFKYLRYLVFPVLLIALVWLSGKAVSFKDSYTRMVNYQTVYTPPAPFEFEILNDSMTAISGVPFLLKVSTFGTLIPETILFERGDAQSYMQPSKNGIFEYSIDPSEESIEFYLRANEVVSGPYHLEVLPVPSLLNFEMRLDYPNYTGKKDEVYDNTGNATVPEGTKIYWDVEAANTDMVELLLPDSSLTFQKEGDAYKLYHSVFKSVPYEITTSNSDLKRFEKLGFRIQVIKDQFPEIKSKELADTLGVNTQKRIMGEISDDYGFAKLELVYHREDQPQKAETVLLSRPDGTLDKFLYTFPGKLNLEEGVNYLFHFRVTDNDALHSGKSADSEVYSFYAMKENERTNMQLEQQKEQIDALGKNIENLEKQESELEELKNINKQKENLSYNDQRKLENFISRQQQQEELMKNYTQKMQENLEQFDQGKKKEDEFNDLLKERLERQQLEIEKNQKLLEELQELSEKIDKEELSNRLEQLAKNQQSNKRSLEQLLELTKRYYVQAKAENIRNDLEDQARIQDSLSSRDDASESKTQQELNDRFEETTKKLEELQQENKQLKAPMELGRDKKEEEQVKEEQKKALEKLENEKEKDPSQPSDANENQKNSSQKIRKIAQAIQSAMSMSNAQMIQEDAAMLRQILDNLLKFTFDQEEILENLNNYDQDHPGLPKYLRRQNDLKLLFEHVDDSLFALSLRRPELSEVVNTNITEVYYNIDKALERFADNQYYQGITHQQYTLTSANNLSDFLSDMLDNMQNMMMGSGSGSGESFQLPDIIQSQEELNNRMQEGMQKENGEQKNGNPNGETQEGEQKQGKEQEGQGQGESMSEEVFEIYKQQQQLRQALEEQLKNIEGEGSKSAAKSLTRQMEQIEEELLNNGINAQTLKRMQYLKHQLLKLEDAEQMQGQKKERESTTNRKEYTQNTSNQLPEVQESYQELEILQRQVLPLREIYKQKVQRYFKGND